MCEKNLNILKDRIKAKDNSQLLSLADLFSGTTMFIIPDYQRGYAWDKEYRDMWNDILRIFDLGSEKKRHYSGLIVLDQVGSNSKERSEGYDAFYVVDGQQRLTTLFIFLKFIIDKLGENLEPIINIPNSNSRRRLIYSANRNNDGQNFFNEYVFGSARKSPDDVYKKNIQDVCNFIKLELKQFDQDDLKKLKNLILNQIVFSVFCDYIQDDGGNKLNENDIESIHDDENFDVRLTFETMNNRGKQLSVLELLKNRMMYLIYNLVDKNSDQLNYASEIDSYWNNIYKNLSEIVLNLGEERSYYSKDETYLRAHWYLYSSRALSKDNNYEYAEQIFSEFSLENMLKGNKKENLNKIISYCKSLSEYSAYWAIVNYPEKAGNFVKEEDVKDEEVMALCELNSLNVGIYYRTLLMLTVAKNPSDSKKKMDFYKKLLDFVFINFNILKIKNDMSSLVTIARQYFNENDKTKLNQLFEKLVNHLDGSEDNPLKFSLKEWKSHPSGFEDKLRHDFIDNYFGSGFYTNKWNGLRYFLYKYDESCPKPNGEKYQEGFPMYLRLYKTSIEHVFPQKITKGDYWDLILDISYPDSKSNEIDKKHKRNILTQMLGNLVLLDNVEQNASIGNRCYPIKSFHIDKYDNWSTKIVNASYQGSTKSSYDLQKKYQNHWTVSEIKERTKTLLDFLYGWIGDFITKDRWTELCSHKLDEALGEFTEIDYTSVINNQNLDDLNKLVQKEINSLPDVSNQNNNNNNVNETYYGDEFIKFINGTDYKIYKEKAVRNKPPEKYLYVEGIYAVVSRIIKDNGLDYYWIGIFTKDNSIHTNGGNLEFGFNNRDSYMYIQSNSNDSGKRETITEEQYKNLDKKTHRFINLFKSFVTEVFNKPDIEFHFGSSSAISENLKDNPHLSYAQTLMPPDSDFVEATFLALKNLGGEGDNNRIYDEVIKILNLSDDVLNIPHSYKDHPERHETEVQYKLRWARTFLSEYTHYIDNIKTSYWKINSLYSDLDKVDGKNVIKQHYSGRKSLKQR